jgi:hypothetical protein
MVDLLCLTFIGCTREIFVATSILCGGRQADSMVAPGVLGRRAEIFDGECHSLGHAADGELAADFVVRPTGGIDIEWI